MRWITRLAALAAGGALSLDPAAAAPSDAGIIHVRVALGDRAAAGQHAALVAEADAIWQSHGVRVSAATPGEFEPEDVRLTVTLEAAGRSRMPSPGRRISDPAGLGAIWFAEDGTPGESITLWPGAVMLQIRESAVGGRPMGSWPPALARAALGRALGRVLAHEIGHYLLSSPAHARTGLMRAAFDGRQLAAWDRREFELDAGALPRLRARLARLEQGPKPIVAANRPMP